MGRKLFPKLYSRIQDMGTLKLAEHLNITMMRRQTCQGLQENLFPEMWNNVCSLRVAYNNAKYWWWKSVVSTAACEQVSQNITSPAVGKSINFLPTSKEGGQLMPPWTKRHSDSLYNKASNSLWFCEATLAFKLTREQQLLFSIWCSFCA